MSLIFLFCTAVGRPCVIPTGSMEKTIRSWDWVWLSHISMVQGVQRGDVVCFPGPEGDKLFCKRVVGLGGDRLEMRDGKLVVNGQTLEEPWAEATHESWGPVQVAPGRLFVMGDHRSNSFDSRYWGTIPRDFVTGKAVVVAFPPNHWRKL
ncbi:MAG: signal peptidase I [Candidatus Eremiobacteraeota bacterium]|nr:signal peptidase I [Candidatus Eremiobacteraeota bacterium]